MLWQHREVPEQTETRKETRERGGAKLQKQRRSEGGRRRLRFDRPGHTVHSLSLASDDVRPQMRVQLLHATLEYQMMRWRSLRSYCGWIVMR